MSNTIFMETTMIEPEKTIAEITTLLVKQKATSIMTEYENGQIKTVCFRIIINGVHVPFRLPCRHEAIQQILASRTREYKRAWDKKSIDQVFAKYKEQAHRVAWRQLLRWVQAQLALVETGMVKVQEVFMPYMQGNNGETMFERLETTNYKMLETQL